MIVHLPKAIALELSHKHSARGGVHLHVLRQWYLRYGLISRKTNDIETDALDARTSSTVLVRAPNRCVVRRRPPAGHRLRARAPL